MTQEEFVEQLLALPDTAAQQRFLSEHAARVDDQVADALKGQADRYLRSDVQHALQTAALLCSLPELTGNPCHRALGLLAEANARSIGGLGEYQRAVELYDEAAAIFEAHGQPAEQARSQVGKVWSLASLGRYDEAFETGAWASRVLEDHAQWRPLATLTMNLAAIHARRGDDAQALVAVEQARAIYLGLGAEGEPFLPRVEGNRAILLRNLGELEAAIQTGLQAQAMFASLGQSAELARAKENLAITYYVLGRYNEALSLLDEVRSVLEADGRQRDVVRLDLATSDCLLQLRRFGDVVALCRGARDRFTALGTRFEAAQAILNEATAYAGLGRFPEATVSLDEAGSLFREEHNVVWEAHTDLQKALLLGQQGNHEESLAIARRSQTLLRDHELPVAEAQASLIAAEALMALGRHDAAQAAVATALALGESRDLPTLLYQGYHLLGTLAVTQNQLPQALTHFDRAISELERLRGRVMIEFRAGFLEDKDRLYQDVIGLCLRLDQPVLALDYVERAKSRALIDILAFELDMQVAPRDDSDRPLTEKLAQLRTERDRIHHRWLVSTRAEGQGTPEAAQSEQVQRDVLDRERQMTAVWHQLLIRRADYARDSALHRVQTEPIQPLLDSDTLLIEWFIADGRPIVFLVTADAIEARPLAIDMTRIQQLLSLLWLNLDSVPRTAPVHRGALVTNAQRLLRQLHQALIEPISTMIARFPRLVIVPHGQLHYLPFQALHDGTSYLVERHEISYLPAGSVLSYCRSRRTDATGALVFGYSCAGRLPEAEREAQSVAQILDGQLYVGEQATLGRLRALAGDCRVLHLATHGDFRADNPLFSGLALADGYLTTLDSFNLRLNAALVTLSGCQTGRSVVGGGDELLGLTRALLAAGAASLVLSLWTVNDTSTALFMAAFYRDLAAGRNKGEALRQAQVRFIRGLAADEAPEPAQYQHPYFWAPFVLIGDAGKV